MVRRLSGFRLPCAVVVLGLLAACSGGGGGTGGGGTPPTQASLDGYVFGASRQAAAEQTLLAGMTVGAYTLPPGASPLATATTSSRGRFSFSPALANGLPRGRTLLIRATGGGRIVSALMNTSVDISTKLLNETTHIASLALLSRGGTSFTDAQIDQHEAAARIALDDALAATPGTDFTANANQAAAAQVASAARALVNGGSVGSNDPPLVSNVTVTPAALDPPGGHVDLSATVTDPESDPLTVQALIYRQAGTAPLVVDLARSGNTWTGGFDVAPNLTPNVIVVAVAIVADDGHHGTAPAVVRDVSLNTRGQVTLDIIAETLFDEAPSRALRNWRLRSPAVIRPPGWVGTRQVNANQTIRGAAVALTDDPNIDGTTDNNGRLFLSVPLGVLDDGLLGLTASIAGRAGYQQWLVLPSGLTVQNGSTLEVNLTLGTAAQWQELADAMPLGTLDFQQAPLVGFMEVKNSVDLQGATPAVSFFRPFADSPRTDDGDFFVTNLPAATVTASAVYADPDDGAISRPWGPVSFATVVGQVVSVAPLVPPGG